MAKRKLTGKQRAFAVEYAKDFNASKAAERAGYSKKTAGQAGFRLLKNVEIWQTIDIQFKKRVMSLNEVLYRLTQHAQGSISDFIDDVGAINWQAVNDKGFLIKKVTQHKDGRSTLELHDGQSALVHLGRYYSLFVDRLKVEDWRTPIVEALRDGDLTPEQVTSYLGDDLSKELFDSAGIQIASS